jgi:hypothetical protein
MRHDLTEFNFGVYRDVACMLACILIFHTGAVEHDEDTEGSTPKGAAEFITLDEEKGRDIAQCLNPFLHELRNV